MKDIDLKYLTLKTAFLLALASGKCHSKIHAWVANIVSNLGQWEKVNFYLKDLTWSDYNDSMYLGSVVAAQHS